MARMDLNKQLSMFINERNSALVSLNEKRIKKLFRKWGVPYPEDRTVFWASVHMSIIEIYKCGGRYVKKEHYERSKEWLVQNGLSHMADGK